MERTTEWMTPKERARKKEEQQLLQQRDLRGGGKIVAIFLGKAKKFRVDISAKLTWFRGPFSWISCQCWKHGNPDFPGNILMKKRLNFDDEKGEHFVFLRAAITDAKLPQIFLEKLARLGLCAQPD